MNVEKLSRKQFDVCAQQRRLLAMSSRHSMTAPRLPNLSVHPLALLDRILRTVELTTEQHADAERSYKAVTEVLAKVGMPVQPYSPFMFAQGSMRIGTTVRPIGQDVHDLDVVCMLRVAGVWLSAKEVFQLVWDTTASPSPSRKSPATPRPRRAADRAHPPRVPASRGTHRFARGAGVALGLHRSTAADAGRCGAGIGTGNLDRDPND